MAAFKTKISAIALVMLCVLNSCRHTEPSLTELYTKDIAGERVWHRIKWIKSGILDTSYYLTDTVFSVVMINDKQLNIGEQQFTYMGSYYKTAHYHTFNVDTTSELRYTGYEHAHGDSYISYYYKESKIAIEESDGGNGGTSGTSYVAQ